MQNISLPQPPSQVPSNEANASDIRIVPVNSDAALNPAINMPVQIVVEHNQ
jgi:hypothetical protein